MEWISVKDRLPNDYTEAYSITVESYINKELVRYIIHDCRFQNNKWVTYDDDLECNIEIENPYRKVIAWTRIEPYEGE